MAQLALANFAAGVGFLIGGPIGAQIGWAAGSMAGAYLFGEKTQGPRLTDLKTHFSSYGAFIPQVWGTHRVGGIVIWATDKEEHENTSSGKGGPEVTNYSYTQSFDTVICRSNGGTRLLRIWANGRLIYDNRTGTVVTGSELPFVFYDGGPTQTADPTEEATIGAGLVPAYRGVSRVVFTDLDLSEFSNVIPQLNFEISTNAEEQPLSRSALWTVFTPSGIVLADHRSVGYNDDGNIVVAYWVSDGAISNYNVATFAFWRVQTYEADGTLISSVDDDPSPDVPAGGGTNILLCRDEPTLSFVRGLFFTGASGRWFKNGEMVDLAEVDAGFGDSYYSVNEEFVYDPTTENVFALAGNSNAYLVRYPAPNAVPDVTYDQRITIGTGHSGNSYTIHRSIDGHIYVHGDSMMRKYDTDLSLLQTWTATTTPNCFPRGVGGQCEGMWRSSWMICEDTLLARVGNGANNDFVLYEMTDTLPWPEISRVNSLTITTQVPLWSLGDGMVLTDDGLLSVCVVDASTVLHGDIVADICEECGLDPSEFDVSELIDRERGVMTTQIMTGRAFIESLMPIRFYDAVDSDTAIKFVKRGKPAVVTIPDGDLAGRGENEEIPDKLEIVRGNDDELPSTLFLKYFNYGTDYQIGTQPWRRQTGISKITQEVNVAMVLTDGEAKRIVDAWGAEIWNGRDKYKLTTLPKYLKYEPTDVITVQGLELRVEKQQEHRAEGKITWEGIRSRPGNFAQPGVGGEAEGFPTQDIPEPQETDAEILDIPLIMDINRQSVVHVGMQGALRRSWRGASLQKSIDGGTNYEQLLVQTSPDSMGECVTKLQNYGGPGPDEANVIRVRMGPGAAELVSVTDTAMMNGANWFAVGASGGAYEIGRYRTATLIDEEDDGSRVYDVSGFLRGRRGTRHYMKAHAIGDRFIALPTNTVLDGLRSDFGRTRHYKAVTIGRTLSSADAIPFRSNAISLTPFAPVDVAAGFIGGGTIRLQWDRRTRLGFGWIPGIEQPLGEEEERYQIRIYEDGTKQTVVNTYESTTTYFDYTSAMQTTDFGGALDVFPAWNVRQKGLVGWGYDSDGQLSQLMPEDFPGYVPPNPAPADTTYFVNSTMPFVSGSQVSAPTLGPNQTWAIAVTVGATPTTLNDLVGLATADGPGGAPVPRIWTFSPIKGDFAPQSTPYSYNLEGSPYPSVQFQVIANTNPGYPVVPSGATWYLNIRTLPTSYATVPLLCNISNVP